jgi:hypothetical protein
MWAQRVIRNISKLGLKNPTFEGTRVLGLRGLFLLFVIVLGVFFKLCSPYSKSAHASDQAFFFSSKPDWELAELVKILDSTSSGQKLLQKALDQIDGKELSDLYPYLKKGNLSYTDTSLTRRFDEHSGEVHYHQSSVVVLNGSLPKGTALLDLAHELTHFAFRGAFNPYVKDFSQGLFLKKTIEDRGGEAHAFLVECMLGEDLGWKEPLRPRDRERCEPYRRSSGQSFKFGKIIEDFYSVGGYLDFAQGHIEEPSEIEEKLNGREPAFISAAAQVPYPVAALQEYQRLRERACDNDRRRAQRLTRLLSAQRSPSLKTRLKRLKSSLAHRCGE